MVKLEGYAFADDSKICPVNEKQRQHKMEWWAKELKEHKKWLNRKTKTMVIVMEVKKINVKVNGRRLKRFKDLRVTVQSNGTFLEKVNERVNHAIN